MSKIADYILAGQGKREADLVVRNVRLLDVISGSVELTDIAIVGERIVGVHEADYHGATEIDGNGRYAVPGFIDTHVHIESSLVTPYEFDRGVLPRGTTTVFCDPHEIANVLGSDGIQYFLDCANHTIMDVRINLSSCIPATPFETSGAVLELEDLLKFRGHPKVHGLAEMMNYPGVLGLDPVVMAKLEAFQDGHIDGHAPLLLGKGLNGYLAAGIRTDHEATSANEAREKLRKGMSILIREGSASKDLEALAEVLDADTSSFIALCTDDRSPVDIIDEGHIDAMVRRLIAKGKPAHHVYRAASISAARIFGLRDRGLVAPGWRADIVLLDDLATCAVSDVISGGRLVTPDLFERRPTIAPIGLNSMKAKQVTPESFISLPKPGANSVPVIGVRAGLLLTFRESAVLANTERGLAADIGQDVLKVSVIERHGKTGNIGCGFVKGFGIEDGAIASSVGHDSHNIAVVGVNDVDMAVAANRVIEMGGGFVVAKDGAVIADFALPIAGLMSLNSFEDVAHQLQHLIEAARDMGCKLPEPFLQLAFIALPVIPHLKMTDRGLFDVDRFAFV